MGPGPGVPDVGLADHNTNPKAFGRRAMLLEQWMSYAIL